MITQIVMLYILKVINAPTWCFVLVWIALVLNALTIIAKAIMNDMERSRKFRRKKEIEKWLKENEEYDKGRQSPWDR